MRARSDAVYLRNTLPQALILPLAEGGARYLPACATTLVDGPTRGQDVIRAALAAGVLVVPLLPGAGAWRRLKGQPLRAPVSAASRHYLAATLGMAGMVTARMQLERAAAEAVIYGSPRWTQQEWRADRAWLKAGEWERQRSRATQKFLDKQRALYRQLREATEASGRTPECLYAVLDDGVTDIDRNALFRRRVSRAWWLINAEDAVPEARAVAAIVARLPEAAPPKARPLRPHGANGRFVAEAAD